MSVRRAQTGTDRRLRPDVARPGAAAVAPLSGVRFQLHVCAGPVSGISSRAHDPERAYAASRLRAGGAASGPPVVARRVQWRQVRARITRSASLRAQPAATCARRPAGRHQQIDSHCIQSLVISVLSPEVRARHLLGAAKLQRRTIKRSQSSLRVGATSISISSSSSSGGRAELIKNLKHATLSSCSPRRANLAARQARKSESKRQNKQTHSAAN